MWSSDKEDEMKEFVVISDVLHDTVAAHAGVKKVSPFSETLQNVIIHPSFLPSLPPASLQGDIIVRVNQVKVRSVKQVRKVISKSKRDK